MKEIAIIGIAGRFPEAANLRAFRDNLLQGRDSIRELSFERRSATTLPLDKVFMEIGYMEDIDLFDHSLFNISRGEAEHMDPHQRLLMEVVYEAIESAGYDFDHFNGTNTAVFIGDTDPEYYRLAERFDPTLITGSTAATTAGRIARFFNLRGNAAMVDTACSSSLMAVHLACNELIWGEADHALACGVRILLFPDEKNTGPQLGILSTDGRTRSFSAKADGSGAGEAVGCVLLKPLDKALADGDLVYAVIKGTAVNQDAQLSGSLTAPSSQAQAEVIKKAWVKGAIDPLTISYIEAHGSGTKLGDPIEIAGIDQAFKGITDDRHFCAVSSVKSNIGHTGGAAGISGLVKAVLSLYYKELYPSVHFDQPNPFIDFAHSVVYVNTVYKAWEAPFPRRAGISSFGLSGTNCHVLLEEAPIVGRDEGLGRREAGDGGLGGLVGEDGSGAFLFNFSARSVGSLEAYLQRFTAYITAEDSASLADISYTLNAGRKHYGHRAAVIAASKAELAAKISDLHHKRQDRTQQEVKKIILLFSGDAVVDEGSLIALSDGYPELKKYIDECALYYTHANAAINRFVYQYAIYRWLAERGMAGDDLLGVGNGDLVVGVILNELSLAEAIAKCIDEGLEVNGSAGFGPGFEDRLVSLVERETGEDKVAFIEAGPQGCLSKGLSQLNYPDKEFLYSVIYVDSSPLEIIQALYLQQYPIDWHQYYAQSDHRRVPLPSYAFERVRCWLRAPLRREDMGISGSMAEGVAPAGGLPGSTLVLGESIPEAEDVMPETGTIVHEGWSEMENTIATIWMAVLRLEQVSLEDDFFRLGGHSLMATKVISIIEKKFGIKLVFKDIFTFATVKALAKGVEALIADGRQTIKYKGIASVPEQAFYPLSEAQRRLWLINQVSGNAIAYNLPAALLLEGPLDIDRLEKAFRALIQRHESLRTSFHEKNAQPIQVVHEEVNFSIQDMANSDDPDSLLKIFIRPFDLSQAPLLRVGLVTLEPHKYLLLVDMHHIISDGVSIAVFSTDLIRLYNGIEITAPTVQYRDFAVWQQGMYKAGAMLKAEEFWLSQFPSGIPVLQLSTDKPRPEVQTFNGNKLEFALSEVQVEKIHSLAAVTGTTPFMLLLAVYNVLLHKYTSQEDIIVGSPIAGRHYAELDNLIGMFVNTLVLRNRPAKRKTFLQFLDEVKENALNAYEHQDYPFGLLVDKLGARKDPSRNPLFDVGFALFNIDIPDIQLNGLSISAYPVNTGAAAFELLLEIKEEKGSWPAKLEYNTALFEAESIGLMKERFIVLLEDILADPQKRIEELSMKIAAEKVNTVTGLDFAFNF